MNPLQEKRLVELLDDMGKTIVEARRPGLPIIERNAKAIGALQFLIWEARKLLDLPDVDGLSPL